MRRSKFSTSQHKLMNTPWLLKMAPQSVAVRSILCMLAISGPVRNTCSYKMKINCVLKKRATASLECGID